MLGENLAHKKFIVFATLFSLDLNTTFEHLTSTVCPRRLDLNYIVTYCIKWVKTSWTGSTVCPKSLVQLP